MLINYVRYSGHKNIRALSEAYPESNIEAQLKEVYREFVEREAESR